MFRSQPRSVGSRLTDIFFAQLWVVLHDLLDLHSRSYHPQYNSCGDTGPANRWLSEADRGIDNDAINIHNVPRSERRLFVGKRIAIQHDDPDFRPLGEQRLLARPDDQPVSER